MKFTTSTSLRVTAAALVAAVVALCVVAQQPATSGEARRLSNETQQEIRRTRSQISENEKRVKENLAELDRLEAGIASSQKTIDDMAGQVRSLDGKITTLGTKISGNEREIERMRSEYAKAVRKMRRARGRHSALAFIFASKDFNQAMRRMRYLREFNAWRDRQTRKIQGKVEELKGQKKDLSATRRAKDKALATSRRAQADLREQSRRQGEVVADLKKHGDALRAYLAEKQREADILKAQISNLIAQEQAKAREEAQRKARVEAERRAREEAAAEKARQEAERARLEAERKAKAAAAEAARREKAAAEEAARKAKAEAEAAAKRAAKARAAEKAKADAEAKKAREEQKKAEQKAREQAERARKRDAEEAEATRRKNNLPDGEEYAKARGRKPRADASKPASQPAGNSGFASMKGSLPRPVSGQFKIVSQFGKHPLADLPSVVYDNPGIDAEVSAGAHAQAVYAGKVSGVYVVPGYNTVVIVSHGDYYTVYGNLSSASVKSGDTVKAGQNLGALAKDPDNDRRTTIHFEVWHNRDKQNPAAWIR